MTNTHIWSKNRLEKEISNLPKFKYQLKDFQDRLKHLDSISDSISEKIYKKLRKKYTEAIKNLSAQIEKLTSVTEEYLLEKEVERKYLQKKQNDLSLELIKAQTACEKGNLSKEDYQKIKKTLNKQKKKVLKSQHRIERDINALNFYLNFEGEESYALMQFEQSLSQIKSKIPSEILIIIEKAYENLFRRQTMFDFIGFRTMVSPIIIKILWIIGVVIFTIGGIVLIFQGDSTLTLYGIGAIILGNLIWRLFCEVWILRFSMHELVSSILKTLKEK